MQFTFEYHATGRVTVDAETEDEAWYEARFQVQDELIRLDYDDLAVEVVKSDG